MKKLIYKSILFISVICCFYAVVLVRAGGYVDHFYEKFTTPKHRSLILGDSRSFQGIQPAIIDDYFRKTGYELPMLNYSFTIAQISYGPAYLKSIQNKLDSGARNGLFILTLNPWVLAQREGDDFTKGVFWETDKPPHNMNNVSMSPNFEYLIRNYGYFHFRTIFRRTAKLHKDGWLEERTLGARAMDVRVKRDWTQKSMDMYNTFTTKWKKSDYRLDQLDKTIQFLQHHGKVVLVRMPIDANIELIEDRFWSNFNGDINRLARSHSVQYLDFSKQNRFQTYDGNHLDHSGGAVFTKELCKRIR